MRNRRRRWTWLALAATTFGTLGLSALGGPPQDPAGDRARSDGKGKASRSRAGAKKDSGKDEKGGLRLVPGNVPEKEKEALQKPAADPLARPQRGGAAAAKGNANANAPAAGAAAAGAGAAPAAGAGNAAAAPGQGQAPAQPLGLPKWPFHYTMKIAADANTSLAASYYPAEKPFEAPVLMMIHETGQGRSGKDFEDPILNSASKTGFAQAMQKAGYAVLLLDLRGHGANTRRDLTDAQWQAMVADLQAAYSFLVDRHNRGEINIGKFGVVALGDAGNLAAAWAAAPGGAVSDDPTGGGRISDLGALVLVSPVENARGLPLAGILPAIAPRFPMLVISGDRDEQSIATVHAVQQVVERHRLSRVAYFDTNLRGMKLLRFFPKVDEAIAKFLDDPVKFRTVEWEPRYLLSVPEYGDVKLVADSGFAAPGQVAGAPAAGAAGAAAGAGAAANPNAAAANPNAAQPKANGQPKGNGGAAKKGGPGR